MLQAPVTIQRGDKPQKKPSYFRISAHFILKKNRLNPRDRISFETIILPPPRGSEAVYFESFSAALFLICAVSRRFGSPDEAERSENGRDGFQSGHIHDGGSGPDQREYFSVYH